MLKFPEQDYVVFVFIQGMVTVNGFSVESQDLELFSSGYNNVSMNLIDGESLSENCFLVELFKGIIIFILCQCI